jgi:hypothetical protein
MPQEQRQSQNPFGTPENKTGGQQTKAPQRLAPDSGDLLKQLDSALKETEVKDKKEQKKRQILKRCGCL